MAYQEISLFTFIFVLLFQSHYDASGAAGQRSPTMDRLSPTKHSATDNLLLYRLAFRRRQRTPSELNLNNISFGVYIRRAVISPSICCAILLFYLRDCKIPSLLIKTNLNLASMQITK